MQTAHILNGGDSRYINLRHILMKWVLLVGVVVLADVVDDGTNLYQFFSMFCHLFALIAVYPSKVTFCLGSLSKICISNIFHLAKGKSTMIRRKILLGTKWDSWLRCSHHSYFSSSILVDFSLLSCPWNIGKR